MARVLAPGSKLATARRLSPETTDSSLGALLGLGPVSGNEMLAMLDWLLARQRWIETSLANRHLQDATLLLYDVSSSYLEGRLCPLAAFGYNRDGKKGKQQIVFGLLCSAAGCPLAVEVFPGNTADPTTLGRQVDKIRKRFGIARIALVGDRGMLTTARLRKQANRYRVRKHFALHVTQDSFAWERQQDSIEAEARLDSLYAIRTGLPDLAADLAAEAAVEAYKSLSGVERAFRTSKDHLRVRPIHVYSENHVRGHVFLCMCAYYVGWHMRRRLAPLLFQDDDPVAARARRDTPVEPAEVSDRAKDKADTKTTPEGFPVHSFPTLLGDLSTIALNRLTLPTQAKTAITIATEPTTLQRQAFDLLGVDLPQTVPITVTG